MFKKYRNLLGLLVLMILSQFVWAVQGPPSSLIVFVGASRISLKPAKDSAINAFNMIKPGIYVKFSIENYVNSSNFVHLDLNMSINKGAMENGYWRESRLCFNYGFGRTYRFAKISISPGLCYSSVGYENTLTKKSIAETRFAPSLGLQTDFIILKSDYRYLALFVEASAMFAKPARWVQQLAIGIAWRPSFRKPEKDKYLPK